MPDEILSEAEAALLKALVSEAPAIGRAIADAIAGKPEAVRRVQDILPEKSESAQVADELRRNP